MNTLETRRYTVVGNKSKRTLTIRVFENGKLIAKYRSFPQNKEDFSYYTNFATQRDIRQFLSSNDYYVIK